MAKSRDVKAGGAYVLLGLRSHLQKGLAKASARLRSFARSAATIGAGISAVGGAILSPLALAIPKASELTETLNKFNVVFGESRDVVRGWSEEFATGIGRSKQQILDFMGGTQDLLVPIGFEAGAATEMSKQITKLTVDLASFNNKADADVLRDLHAALTGSGEVMKKYGVIVSQAAVKQEMLNQGIDPKAATEAQKTMARMSIIMAGTTAAQGDAERSAGSFANQMKRLKAQADDVLAAIGAPIVSALESVMAQVTPLVSKLVEWVEANPRLIATVAAVGAGLVAAGAVITGMGAAAAAASIALSGLVSVAAALAGPLGAVLAVLAAATAATVAWVKYTDSGRAALAKLTEVFTWAYNWAREVFGGIAAALQAGDMALAAEIGMAALQAVFYGALNKVVDMFGTIKAAAGTALDAALPRLQQGVQYILELFGSLPGWLSGIFGSMFGQLPGFLTSIFPNFSAGIEWIKTMFAGLGARIGETFTGIGQALQAGDWQGAVKIAWTSIKLTFMEGVGAVTSTWHEFTAGLLIAFDNAVTAVRKKWNDVVGWIGKKLVTVHGWFNKSLDIETAIGFVDDDTKRKNDALQSGTDARNSARAAEMTAKIQATRDALEELRKERETALQDAADKAESGDSKLDETNERLAELVAKANNIRDVAAADAVETPEVPAADMAAGLDVAAEKVSPVGSFSTAAVQAMFAAGRAVRGPEEETARNTKKTADELAALNKRAGPLVCT